METKTNLMKTTVEEINPKWAAQILETKNPNNRRMSDRVIDKYANDMLAGNWCLTHQGIGFDENGELVDGQHRLAAVVRAQKPIRMLVTKGLPAKFKNNGHSTSIFSAIDAVRPRSAAVAFELLSYKNSKLMASIARSVAGLCYSSVTEPQVSGANALEIVKSMGGSVEKIATVSHGTKIIRIRASVLGLVAFWHTSNPEGAESFLVDVQGVTGPKKSPSRTLAAWLSNHPGAGKTGALNSLYVTASAIHHQSQGNSIEKLYGSEESVKWLLSTNKPLVAKITSLFKL